MHPTTLILVLAGAALKSTVILALAWLATAAMRKASAAARHAVWTGAFAAVLVLPLLSGVLPGFRAPLLSRVLPSASDPVFRTSVAGDPGVAAGHKPASALGAAGAPQRFAFPDWRVALLLVWGAGTLLLLLRTAFGCVLLERARRQAGVFTALKDELGAPAGVRILKAPAGSMPLVFGIVRPVVLMPADALLWEAERRAMVLQHEFAHIERGDLATHFVARAGLSLLWWNPLAWKAWGEFLKERERAADDFVLRAGAKASAYASHLLEIARSGRQDATYGLAAVAMARPAQLEGRLMAILDSANNHGAPRRLALVAAGAAVLAVSLPLAALRAQDAAQAGSADIAVTIQTALAQKNPNMLDRAAATLMRSKQYDVARQLEDTALQVRASESGERSPSYVTGLLKIAELEMARKNTGEATAFYEKAIAAGSPSQVFAATMGLGVGSFQAGNVPAAAGYFGRANSIAPTPDLQSRAMLMQALTDPFQADAHYQAAIATAAPNSGQRIAGQRLYAQFLEAQGRKAEADAVNAQAGELAKSHAAAPGTAVPQSETGGPVMKVGNGVTQPIPLSHPEPFYSEEARLARYQGSVLLAVVIGPDGRVSNIAVIRPLGEGLDEKAIDAVSQWTFKPGALNGQPVSVQAQIEVNFRLL